MSAHPKFTFFIGYEEPGNNIQKKEGWTQLPEDPAEWVSRLKESIARDGIQLQVHGPGDGGGMVNLSFGSGGEPAENDFAIGLPNEMALLLGKSLIAAAELNPPLKFD